MVTDKARLKDSATYQVYQVALQITQEHTQAQSIAESAFDSLFEEWDQVAPEERASRLQAIVRRLSFEYVDRRDNYLAIERRVYDLVQNLPRAKHLADTIVGAFVAATEPRSARLRRSLLEEKLRSVVFTELRNTYEAIVVRVLQAKLRQFPEIDVDDICQDVFLKLFSFLSKPGAKIRNPEAFLVSMAIRTAIDAIRASRHRPEPLEAELAETTKAPELNPESELLIFEQSIVLEQFLNSFASTCPMALAIIEIARDYRHQGHDLFRLCKWMLFNDDGRPEANLTREKFISLTASRLCVTPVTVYRHLREVQKVWLQLETTLLFRLLGNSHISSMLKP